jgi:hypothetical protein
MFIIINQQQWVLSPVKELSHCVDTHANLEALENVSIFFSAFRAALIGLYLLIMCTDRKLDQYDVQIFCTFP